MTDIVIEAVEAKPVVELPKEKLVDTMGQHIIMLEDCVLVMVGDTKSVVEKRISYEDFRDIIGGVVGHRNQDNLEGFQLPSNCFYFARSSETIQLSCYYGERVADMRHNTKKYTVKAPNFVISHNLQKQGKIWRVTGSRYFCTNAKVGNLPKSFIWSVNGNQHIYLSPFPNTYSEGNMCYGHNSMPSQMADNNLRGLDWYYQFLFESSFNNDLGLRALSTEPSIENWFKKLADTAKENKPFPYEDLRGFKAV